MGRRRGLGVFLVSPESFVSYQTDFLGIHFLNLRNFERQVG